MIGVEAATGKIHLNEKVFHSENPEPLGNGASMNCYATPSPVIEPDRVYVHFGRFGTACLDTVTGKTIWKRDDIQCRHYRGPASSLVIFEKLLILTMDGVDVQYLVALDKQTGKTVWRTDRSVAWNDENVPGPMARDGDLRKAHSTPHRRTHAAERRVTGQDPRVTGVRPTNWSGALEGAIPRLVDRTATVILSGRGVLCHGAEQKAAVGCKD